MKNQVYDKILAGNAYLNKIKNSTIMITGATGTVGFAVAEFLAYCNDNYDAGIKLVCPVRNPARLAVGLRERRDVNAVKYDLAADVDFDFEVDYVIHCAGPTRSKFMVENPVDTIDAIYGGTKKLLEYFKYKGKKGFLYVSSVEVYGENFDADKSFTEDTLGAVDQLNVRSSYPEAKRLAETLCTAYSSQYNLPVKIARLTQIIGAGQDDNRLIAYLCDCAKNKNQIVLKSDGKATKAYCPIDDCVSALICILVNGENTAYNVANKDMEYSVRELAEFVADKYIGKKVVIENQESAIYPKSSYLVMDSAKLCDLGWTPVIGLREAFDSLITERA